MNAPAVRRPQGPFSDLLEWLEGEVPYGLKRMGIAPTVPIEDFMDEGHYVVRAELPGIDPEQDVNVTLENDVLTISGERQEDKREKNLRELRYGAFTRAVRVPSGTSPEQISATYTDGILEVRVPVPSTETTSQSIEIKRGA